MPALLISVRFHDGRYHGRPDWPPSPARLFQALVAGAGRGRMLDEADAAALRWLETLDAPLIAAPHHRPGQGFSNYVPNNDLDAKGGDPARTSEIRAPKLIKPILFEADTPLLYLWRFRDASHEQAQRVCTLAERLYQLGRGVDMAWASGEVFNEAEIDERLTDYEGAIHTPTGGAAGHTLFAPMPGSLDSLIARHQHQRFERVPSNRKQNQLFRQPPKPRFRQIGYDSPPTRLLFDLIGEQAPVSLTRIAALTVQIRDAAAERLSAGLPNRTGEIERCLIGRGADEADKHRRVRITPLPSIGHRHVSPAIRRILVDIPATCPLRAGDIDWAFSGLEIIVARIDEETGEVTEQLALTPASDRGMLRHYGVESDVSQRLWRTVTPLALPVTRRRIDPAKLRASGSRSTELKPGKERSREERDAAASVRQALRQAGVRERADKIRVQRAPFSAKGARAEEFEPETGALGGRFSKHRLWHAEISFAEPQRGPLQIGDGRYLGLGLMAPVTHSEGIIAFEIRNGPVSGTDHVVVTRALRRAVMARVAEILGREKPLPAFFSGHEPDGQPVRSGRHRHLAYVYDAELRRLLILAPHILERRAPDKDERQWIAQLERAVSGMRELRAGAAGVLHVWPSVVDANTDRLFAASKIWENVTPFRVTRHTKLKDARLALARNLLEEVRHAGLPVPQVDVLGLDGDLQSGLAGRARLSFERALNGPLLFGRDKHFGGGVFIAIHRP